jgi:hypothetical protein
MTAPDSALRYKPAFRVTLRQLRLATGLVLFAFATTHFLNHAVGLVSIDMMEEVRSWRIAVTRSVPGTFILLASFPRASRAGDRGLHPAPQPQDRHA